MITPSLLSQKTYNPWIETFGISVTFIGLGTFMRPLDPLFLDTSFPWVILIPLLIALRYGVFFSLISIGLFLLSGIASYSFSSFPKEIFIGMTIIAILAGQYHETWSIRYRRLEESSFYIEERLDHLTNQHYLLKLSHDNLEQTIVTKPVTLRDALLRLRMTMSTQKVQDGYPALKDFLEILSSYCQVTKASIFLFHNERLNPQAIASIGTLNTLQLHDKMVTHALETRKIVHINHSSLNDYHDNNYLIVAPLLTNSHQDNNLIGIVVIEEMPFFALHEESVQMIAILSAYYAESIDISQRIHHIQSHYPLCPHDFADEIEKLFILEQKFGIESHLVALIFPENHYDVLQEIIRLKRQLDSIWEIPFSTHKVLITLMPLADQKAVEGYIARMTLWYQEHYKTPLEQSSIRIYSHNLSGCETAPQLLQEFLNHVS